MEVTQRDIEDAEALVPIIAQAIADGRRESKSRYVATLTLEGTVYVFDSDNAVDQGDYVGEFVKQKSLMVTLPDCPFTVFFRPDVDGKRDEVVVELGKMWSGTPAHVRVSYTLKVEKNGVELFTQTVPYHWWWARWRWQSAPRPLVRDGASLVAAKHLLPHSSGDLYGYKPTGPYSYNPNYHYTPMALGGIMHAMGTGGDRPEIGPITKPQADYIVLGTPLARDVMMAQAESSASWAFHIRDEKTGRWFDNRANPYYSLNPASNPPKIPIAPAPSPQVTTFAYLQTAHIPNLSYVPFMLTDDPYLLEEVQAAALYSPIENNYHQNIQKLPGMAGPSEVRGFAWGLRDMALAARATPETVPSWLTPKAHYLANLADSKTYMQRFMDSPARIHRVFRAFPRSDLLGSFQEDYMMIVLAWIARIFPDWKPQYEWAMGAIMPHVLDGRGWLKGWPAPYYFKGFINTIGTASLIKDTSQDANTYATWDEAFERYVLDKGGTNDPTLGVYPPQWDGVSIRQVQSSAGYFLYRLATLRLAEGAGIPDAAGAGDWLEGQMPALFQRYGGTNDPRFSFAPTP